MNKSKIIKIDFLFLIAVCVFTVGIILYASHPWGANEAYQNISDYFSLIEMMIWSVSPYLGFLITLFVLIRKSILIKTFSAFMFIICFLSVFILLDTMFIHIDAQGALIFIFLPMYQWLAFCFMLFIFAVVEKFGSEKGTQHVNSAESQGGTRVPD